MALEKVLKIKDIRLQFGGLQALEGVDLHVGRHEILAIIGPNGDRKSVV